MTRWWFHGDFRRLWVGQSVSEFGSQFTVIAMQILMVEHFHASAAALGVLGALRYLPFLFLGAPVGAWADGRSKRQVMIWSDLVRAAILFAVPVLYAAGHLTVVVLLVVALATGTARVFFDVANQAYVGVTIGHDRLVDANAVLANATNVSRAVGPGVGGVVVQVVGAPLALLVDAVSFVVNAVSVARISRDGVVVSPGASTFLERLRGGMHHIRTNTTLARLLISSAVSNVAVMSIQSIFVLVALRDLGFSPWEIGAAGVFDAVGVVAGASLAGRLGRRLDDAAVLKAGYAVVVVGTVLIAVATGPLWCAFAMVSAGYFVWGLGLGLYNVVNMSLRQQLTPQHLMASVMGSWRTVVFGALPVGAVLGGVCGELAGGRAGLWVGVAANVLALVVVAGLATAPSEVPKEGART